MLAAWFFGHLHTNSRSITLDFRGGRANQIQALPPRKKPWYSSLSDALWLEATRAVEKDTEGGLHETLHQLVPTPKGSLVHPSHKLAAQLGLHAHLKVYYCGIALITSVETVA